MANDAVPHEGRYLFQPAIMNSDRTPYFVVNISLTYNHVILILNSKEEMSCHNQKKQTFTAKGYPYGNESTRDSGKAL
jgi:hypothetical protein